MKYVRRFSATIILLSLILFSSAQSVHAQVILPSNSVNTACIHEKENNNSPGNADNLGEFGCISGNIQTSSDIDYFYFEMSKDGFISINFSHDMVESTNLYWEISLKNSRLEEIVSYGVRGVDVEKEYGKIGLPQGKYYVCITDNNFMGHTHSPNNYRITIEGEQAYNWEKEFNDTSSSSDVINVNNNVYGTIRNDVDKDYYKFTINKPGKLNIQFKHDMIDSTNYYWEIYLLDSKQQIINKHIVAGNTIQSSSGSIGVPAGIYYVKIKFFENFGTYYDNGVYNFNVDYEQSNAWEQEFNDTAYTANTIDVDRYVNGTIKDEDDMDFYKIYIPNKCTTTINFNHEYVESNYDLWTVYLLNSNQEVISKTIIDKENRQTTIDGFELEKGVYYIKVTCLDFIGKHYKNVDYKVALMTSGWKQNNVGYWYVDNRGNYVIGWKYIGGSWYYFNNNGYMVTGWQNINGKQYYFYESGNMASNVTIDGIYLQGSGEAVTYSWKSNSNGWWYEGTDGSYVTGWKYIGSSWYYFDNSGYMVTGWKLIEGKWYYFDDSGYMLNAQWKWIEGNCYYFYKDGHMASNETIDGSYVNNSGAWTTDSWGASYWGWWYNLKEGGYVTSQFKDIDGNTYYFGADGYMTIGWKLIEGKWYYFDDSGHMLHAQWKWINDNCYYFYEDGHMASNETINGSYVNNSGAWVP